MRSRPEYETLSIKICCSNQNAVLMILPGSARIKWKVQNP
jgi:hypothetical protein